MKMNKLALLLSMFAMGVSVAQAAAPTAELKVKGMISPGSCTVTAPDNGEYDLGTISASTIKPSSKSDLPKQTKGWLITCDADTALTFKVVDNRSSTVIDSEVGDSKFGLGSVNGTGKIGRFRVFMRNLTVDGETALVLIKHSSSSTANMFEWLDTTNTFGWASHPEQELKLGKVFKADLRVEPMLGSIADMNGPVTSDVNLDGSLTLNFAYGI